MTKLLNEIAGLEALQALGFDTADFAHEMANGIIRSALALGKETTAAQLYPVDAVAGTNLAKKVEAGLDLMAEKLPKSKRELARKTETAALGFISTIPPETMKKAFLPVLLSLWNEGKVPDKYPALNKAAAKRDIEECLIHINDYKKALRSYNVVQTKGGRRKAKDTSHYGQGWVSKYMLSTQLPSVVLKLELPEEAFEDLARDHAIWQARDAIAGIKTFAEAGIGEVIMILDLADIRRYAARDMETRKYIAMVLDNIFMSGKKKLSKTSLKQKNAMGIPRFILKKNGNLAVYKEKEDEEETPPVPEEVPEPEEDPNAIDQRSVPVSEHIMENYIMQNTKNIVSEYALQAPFRNTEQNKKQKTRVKNWLASKMKGPDGAWFDFFRTMRYENETDKGFTALFLARQGLSREDIESEFSRRRATNQLKTAFSPDRGNPDVVFKKYEKEILNRLFTLYGCYVLDDMDFDSDGNLVLEFEWDGRVEGIIGNIETGEQYSMSMDARDAQGPVWKGTDPDDLLKRLKAANPKAKIRGAKALRTAAGTPPGVNEGITDIFKMFKKEKVYTVEDFFRISTGSPKEQGVKGLVLKMIDNMTPDINMKARDQADARYQATKYLTDYMKTSFIGEIENLPTRKANDWEDFAEFISGEAWGENIGWDSLITAAKELYDHANEAHTEALPDRKAGGGLTGDPTQALDQLQLMLGVNTIPLVLLKECLRALGKRMHRAKKNYKNKRVSKPVSENKILKEYIMQNTPQQSEDISIIEIIADEVNETLNNLPEVQIASEILNEDELKDLFSPLAKQVVIKVRGQIEEEIKKLVELQVTAAQLKDAIAQRLAMDPDNPVTGREKEVLLANFTQEDLEAAGIEFEVTDEEGTGPATES